MQKVILISDVLLKIINNFKKLQVTDLKGLLSVDENKKDIVELLASTRDNRTALICRTSDMQPSKVLRLLESYSKLLDFHGEMVSNFQKNYIGFHRLDLMIKSLLLT